MTSHHLALDWAHLREHGARDRVLRVRRQAQPISGWADFGVVNDIYGFAPPAPPAFFHHATVVEAVTTAAAGAITLAPGLAPAERAAAFAMLGAAPLLSAPALVGVSAALVTVGFLTMAAPGIVLGAKIHFENTATAAAPAPPTASAKKAL